MPLINDELVFKGKSYLYNIQLHNNNINTKHNIIMLDGRNLNI